MDRGVVLIVFGLLCIIGVLVVPSGSISVSAKRDHGGVREEVSKAVGAAEGQQATQGESAT